MDPTELDVALEELEIRLERLRALYEQYFLGIEKIAPAVVRADVDRRIWALRKEQIRNTARRFKLQTIVQRYNTFQQYWQRICREIENGTYTPHVTRARRRMEASTALTIAARRRLGEFGAQARKEAAEQATQAVREAEEGLTAALDEASREPSESKAYPSADSSEPLGSLESNGAPPERAPPVARESCRPRRVEPPPSPTERLSRRSGHTNDARTQAPPPGAAGATRRRLAPPPRPGSSKESPSSASTSGRQRPPPARPAARATERQPPASAEASQGRGGRAHPAQPVPRAASGSTSLSERRFEEIHRQLLAARRQNNETGTITVQDLKRRLQATEQQLRRRHQNRSVDFDVVIKNGRTIIKPIVR